VDRSERPVETARASTNFRNRPKVSGLAVTASLIYLALQTHQNAKHTRALIHQGRVAALRDILLAGADPNVAAALSPFPAARRRHKRSKSSNTVYCTGR